MSDCLQRLTEAREALHQLQLGKQIVRIEVQGAPGRSIAYTPASIEQLKRYIALLETECGSGAAGGGARRGCITFHG